VVGYSRCTIANVETGRQNVPRNFWERADSACRAGGSLTEASAEIEATVRREREEAAHQARPSSLVVSASSDAGAARSLVPISADALTASGRGDGWLDEIAIAASQARGDAELAAVTELGPGTVEQLAAEVARLSRAAYFSAPPLPLFAAMHKVVSRIQAGLDQKAYPAQAWDLNFLAGALYCLMANACLDLGREEAADDLARAAWTHARIIDHDPLIGWARGTQALAALWGQRYPDAVRCAKDGLTHLPGGMGVAAPVSRCWGSPAAAFWAWELLISQPGRGRPAITPVIGG
jgi:hypothetical protein